MLKTVVLRVKKICTEKYQKPSQFDMSQEEIGFPFM